MGIQNWKCKMTFAAIVSILSDLLLLVKKKFKKSYSEKVDEKMCMPLLEVKSKPKFVRWHGESCLPDDIIFNILARISRSKYPQLACVSRRYRSLIGNGYLYDLRKRLGVTEQWVYIYTSSQQWDALDVARRRWISLPNIPSTQVYSESLTVESKLLVFGRQDAGFAIWVYNFITNEWSRCHPMTFSRSKFAYGSRGEIAIVAGGIDVDDKVLKSAELYNSETGVWETLPDMNCPRQSCSGFFMDEKFYAFGGTSSNGGCLTCWEEYNFETRTWRRIMGICSILHILPLVAVANNELYAADPISLVYKKYDKINNTWRKVGTLPGLSISRFSCVLAFTSYADRLVLVSGYRGRPPTAIYLNSWCPEVDNGRQLEWCFISDGKHHRNAHFCAVMSC